MIDCHDIAGVILAGGRSSRMGGIEKALIELESRPLLSHVTQRLEPQVARLILSANGDSARFGLIDIPILPDLVEGFAGPLAGIATALQWATQNGFSQVVSAAADTPFFPADLVARLTASISDRHAIALASTGGNVHPVFGLWPVALLDDLLAFLASGENASVMRFVSRNEHSVVDFSFVANGGIAHDPFFNINTPQDLEQARQIAARQTGDHY